MAFPRGSRPASLAWMRSRSSLPRFLVVEPDAPRVTFQVSESTVSLPTISLTILLVWVDLPPR